MNNLHENQTLRNKRHIFADRFDAGDQLAEALREQHGSMKDAIVLAIPSGGVPIGLRVARGLSLPMDLIIVRKLQIPWNPEAGFGAMSQDGEMFLNQELVDYAGITREQIQAQRNTVRAELEARNREFRGNRPFPDLHGKTVIITDDGLASGFTMLASIHLVRQKKAAGIVVAVPTAPLRSIKNVAPFVEAIYSLHVQDHSGSFAVAEAYQRWHDLSREEVKKLLRESRFINTLN